MMNTVICMEKKYVDIYVICIYDEYSNIYISGVEKKQFLEESVQIEDCFIPYDKQTFF